MTVQYRTSRRVMSHNGRYYACFEATPGTSVYYRCYADVVTLLADASSGEIEAPLDDDDRASGVWWVVVKPARVPSDVVLYFANLPPEIT